MGNESLAPLFEALCNPDNKCRREAEIFVQKMINEQKIDFVEQIIDELNQETLSYNQICYSFIIIKRFLPFYNEYPKIIQTSLKYFGNQNEQVRILSMDIFCSCSINSLELLNDDTSIKILISLLTTSTDYNILYSCIRSFDTIMTYIPSSTELYTQLTDFLFNIFLQCESLQLNSLFLLTIKDIIPYISDSYFRDKRVIEKLFFLIQNIETKQFVYLVFDRIADYFYSTEILSDVIFTIMEISCNDLLQVNDSDTLLRIISFWIQIASIELQNEVNFLYINKCGVQLSLFLLQLLLRKIDYNGDEVEQSADWSPTQASRYAIKLFCQICPDLISPVLFQFINESNDLETNFFIISILAKTVSKSEVMVNQIPNFLSLIYSNWQSSSARIRYASLKALKSFTSLDFLPPEQFDPFFSIFLNEWTDIEQNALQSFTVYAKIISKLQFEKQTESIIQMLQNLNQMPIQYISHFLDAIHDINIKMICESENEILILYWISFFYEFLSNLNSQFNIYPIVDAIVCIIDSLLLSNCQCLPLTPFFSQLLHLLMSAFSEHTIPIIPLTISRLFFADQEDSAPHIPAIFQFFISLLNNRQSLTCEMKNTIVVSMSMLIYVNGAQTYINDVYDCLRKILVETELDDFQLMNCLFGFFQEVLFFRPIDGELTEILFNSIQKYFSISNDEVHRMSVEYSSFLIQLIEFLTDFVINQPNSCNDNYLTIIKNVLNKIENLEYKDKKMYEKAGELLKALNKLLAGPDIE